MDKILNTKDLILSTAERLFAEHGQENTSMRQLTAEAGVNLAAINYHFGSKQELVRAVYQRRLTPLNDERSRRLQELQAKQPHSAPAVRDIIRAFIEPALQMSTEPEGGEAFTRLLARAYLEPDEHLQSLLKEHYAETMHHYFEALKAALPELSEAELTRRTHFLVGAMAYSIVSPSHLKLVTDRALRQAAPGVSPGDDNNLLESLLAFLTAGMETPAQQRTVNNGGQP